MRRGGNGGQIVLAGPDDEVVGTSVRMMLVKVAIPWVLLLVTLAAGAVAHAYWGTDPLILPWITPVLALGTAGLTWLSWVITTRARFGPVGRAHVATTVAVLGVWLLLALLLGPWTRGVIDMFWLVGCVLALSWNLRGAIHRPRKRDGEDGEMTPRKAARAWMASIGMKGDTLEPEEITPTRVGGRLALESGQHTVEDAQKRAVQMATALGIPKSGVRITENKDDASRPEFSFTMRDVLTTSTPWPGPSAIGGTPFDPIPMGIDETGKRRYKVLADKAGAKHELQQGMTGSGKSSGSKIEMCELMTRRETALIVIDTTKGLQTFGVAAPALSLFITKTELAEKLIDQLMKVVTGRASYLGARRLSEWQPGCGLSFLVVQIEEAANLIAQIGDEGLEMLARAARSAGVSIKISLQRPSHDQLSTTTRGQLGTVTCYGMAADDPVCLLPDEVIQAGADPQKWGDRQPGCNYHAGTGVTVAEAATPMRNYEITTAQFEAHAAEWGPRMDPLDEITAQLLGDLWTRRERPVDMVRRLESEALRGLPAAVRPDAAKGRGTARALDGAGDVDDLDDDEIEARNEDAEVQVSPEEMGIDFDPELDDEFDDDGVTLDDDIESSGVDLEFGPPPAAQVSTDQARAAVAAKIAEIEQAGGNRVRVPDLADLVASGMRSRAWFRKELLRLCKSGRLAEAREPGEFRILPAGPADGLDDDPADDLDDDQAA